MVRREVVMLEDDLDGKTATETVRFGVDGVLYEIDLSERNAKKLRDVMGAYIAVARRVGRSGGASSRAGKSRARLRADREHNRAIREWAAKGGRTVAGRGRIPADIVAEYEAAAGRRAG